MKPVNEREAQYLWSQKSNKYKKRYFSALGELYKDAASEEVKDASQKVMDKYQLSLKNLAQK